ncbi:MAG: hypothetical protein HY290_09550 [Planctomycetia bacterium]|nr:hypothetical protein [Planctomycetia bacterium]
MSRSIKTASACAAILVAALTARNFAETADDTAVPSDKPDRARSGEPHRGNSGEQPRGRSRPRGSDAPLAHAIIKKEEQSGEEKILRSLEKPTNVEWSELAFEDCITYLHEFHQITMILEKAAVAEEGVALDQPITLKLQGVRLDSVLNLLLEPVGMDWVIQDEVLKITTRTWCEAHPEVQTHEIQALIDAGHTPEELIASIVACIEPDSWKGKEAYAGIAHTGGVLVVRQTQRAHSEINKLLSELDDIAARDAEDRRGHDKPAVVSVKVYSTGDQPAEQVAKALQEFVEFGSWKVHDGGAGEVRALNGTVVVKQSAHVHRLIQRFLSQLEQPPRQMATTNGAPAPASSSAGNAAPDPFRVLPDPHAPSAPRSKSGNPLRQKR